MTATPKAFVSHSHVNRSVAEELAGLLRAKGVDAWFDHWEIQPGDSLIQKIFHEGLGDCAVFVVLLSPESVASRWVREELDVALVQRLEGATRVIPVVARPCTVPVPLRALMWLDVAAAGVSEVAGRIADVAFGRTAKPPLGKAPGPAEIRHVRGLSDYGAALAFALAPGLQAEGGPRGFDGPSLSTALSLTPTQVNDAVDELVGLGMLRSHTALGTHPFDFFMVVPTYALALQLRGTDALDYDPEEDIVTVAAAVAALEHASGPEIAERLNLPPPRVDHAVSYLTEYGHVRVLQALGTAPYHFMQVTATAATRRFVESHGK